MTVRHGIGRTRSLPLTHVTVPASAISSNCPAACYSPHTSGYMTRLMESVLGTDIVPLCRTQLLPATVRCAIHLVMCRLRLRAVGQAEPGLCGPGQAGPYFRPHVAFGPASYDRKPEPAAQAAALKYKIFQFFKDAIWVLSALVMLSIVAQYLLAYWRQHGACGPHPVT